MYIYVCKYMYTCMPSRDCPFCYNSAAKRLFGNACSWMLRYFAAKQLFGNLCMYILNSIV